LTIAKAGRRKHDSSQNLTKVVIYFEKTFGMLLSGMIGAGWCVLMNLDKTGHV